MTHEIRPDDLQPTDYLLTAALGTLDRAGRGKEEPQRQSKLEVEQSCRKSNITNLSIADEEFLYNVNCDIDHFIKQRHHNGVLLFPPVNNFRRFLIHQTCENFREKYDLFTFSVGQGPLRRTVVCFKSQLIDPQKYTDSAASGNFETRNRHNNTQIKNWRSDKRESDPIYFSNNNTNSSLAIANSTKRYRKMGVEKNLIDVKLNKSNSLDLYRPPALRNHGNESNKRTDCIVIDAFDVHHKATASLSSITATATTTTTTTSISCNNSPIHRKEDTSSVTTDTTTSTHLNSEHSTQQKPQPQQKVDEEQQKQPQSLCRQQQARRERRPDRAVYIPRARRSQTTPPTTTTQIQQPPPPPAPAPPITAQVSAPTANGTTAATTSAATKTNQTSKSLSQQLAITSDDTTAALVNEKPSSKADEVGKTNCISNNTTKKREKSNKETRERREQRAAKKSLSIQLNHNSKNNTKSNENTNKIIDDAFSSTKTVIVIAQKTPLEPVLKSSASAVNSINCVEELNSKVPDCDRDGEVILDAIEGSDGNHDESRVITNYLSINQNDDNCVINEFETQLSTESIESVSNNFTNTSNNLTTHTTSDIITMPKLSNKTKSNKVSSGMDNGKMPNLRIEDIASQPAKCDIEEQELQRASKEINRSNRRIMKQTFVSDVLQIPDHIVEDERNSKSLTTTAKKTSTAGELITDSNTEEDEEEDDWENMYDESGECLDPKIMQELTASVGKCKIELPKMDYSAFSTKQSILNEEEFPHVLEVSNFPVEFKNQDLLMVFSQYKESGFDIKWVDDTHALAVFSSSRIAAEVLTMGHPFVVLKPLAEATVESRLKAKKCAGSLQPYRPRPETCAALARRLVTGALGVRLKTAAAERENEKRVLREAKERKLLAAKQRDEAWES